MMIDATVTPQVGFINPFGTTACNVNHINARRQARLKAGARDERTLAAVACTPWFGPVLAQGLGEMVPASFPFSAPGHLMTFPPATAPLAQRSDQFAMLSAGSSPYTCGGYS